MSPATMPGKDYPQRKSTISQNGRAEKNDPHVINTQPAVQKNHMHQNHNAAAQPRSEIEDFDKKPLLKPLFAGAIDTVGGVILENIIKSTDSKGAVTCCGNVASPKLDLTVFPFILRGVTLIGIDSQNYPMDTRKKVWEMLSDKWKPEQLEATCNEIHLNELQHNIELMLQGQLKGRIILKLVE